MFGCHLTIITPIFWNKIDQVLLKMTMIDSWRTVSYVWNNKSNAGRTISIDSHCVGFAGGVAGTVRWRENLSTAPEFERSQLLDSSRDPVVIGSVSLVAACRSLSDRKFGRQSQNAVPGRHKLLRHIAGEMHLCCDPPSYGPE